jgi:WhiB family transcriptional regulator, redox-sensing transcriptional regulator
LLEVVWTNVADISRLPVPSTEIWEWQLRAACRGMDSDAFFHPERERGVTRQQREAGAKQVCSRCAVIDECRRHALAVEEPYGVWGGFTEVDRKVIVQARLAAARTPKPAGRGLPSPKHDAQPPSDSRSS